MTITEIIDGLEEIQHSKPQHITEKDITRVCALTVELANHVYALQSSLRTHQEFGDHR